MKRILLMSLLAISTALSAQKPVELELWPDGAPNSNGTIWQTGSTHKASHTPY